MPPTAGTVMLLIEDPAWFGYEIRLAGWASAHLKQAMQGSREKTKH